MPDNPASDYVPNKRNAPRFALPLHVQLQKHGQQMSDWTTARLREVSIHGFYFLSDIDYDTGARFNFFIPFEPPAAGKSLLSGIASIVRCETLNPSQDGAAFGIAARIEETAP